MADTRTYEGQVLAAIQALLPTALGANGGLKVEGVAGGSGGTVTIASGGVTSGAIASGAVASGAVVDGAIVTLGAKADAANTATDTTAVSGISLLKQISKTLQALCGLDNGPAWTVTRTLLSSADLSSTAGDLTTAPATGKYAYADDILISTDAAMRLDVQMESTANVLASVYLPANGTVQLTLRDGIKGDATGKKLQLKSSAAGNIRAMCAWHEVS